MEAEWIPITLINQSKAKGNCRFLSVTQETIGKLKMIRPGVYFDDPRLTFVKELPEHRKPVEDLNITPEMKRAGEEAFRLYKMLQDAKPVTSLPIVRQPEPKPLSFEEQIQHDWRFNPGIRKEFTSFGSYQAFMRAQKAGRCKVYGCGQGTS
jgi:hypothetical protein